jgi:hypothetical protein
MGALMCMPPKQHDDMKLGKPKPNVGKIAKRSKAKVKPGK